MIGRAIKAEVDTEGHRGPCWVLLAAVEADLAWQKGQRCEPQGIRHEHCKSFGRTLFAGLVFSFSKIFCDCCLDASAPLILAVALVREWTVSGT